MRVSSIPTAWHSPEDFAIIHLVEWTAAASLEAVTVTHREMRSEKLAKAEAVRQQTTAEAAVAKATAEAAVAVAMEAHKAAVTEATSKVVVAAPVAQLAPAPTPDEPAVGLAPTAPLRPAPDEFGEPDEPAQPPP